MNIRTTKGIAAAAVVIGYLLMSSVLSWGDTSIYVYQTATTGVLTIKTIDCNGIKGPAAQTIPNNLKSCFTPDLFWDSAAGELRLNGFDSSNNPSWTGTIDAAGNFTTTMATLPTVTCTSAPASVVNAAFPDTTSMLAYSQACTSWNPGAWAPSPCAAGTVQTRTVTGVPAGCVGFPTIATVQSCPPQACASYSYTLGTCQSNNTAPVVSYTGFPAGCSGGVTPATTQPCVYNAPICTSWTYSAWSPSETTCTAGQTLTRSIITSSPNPCNGGNPVLSEACPNGGGLPGEVPISKAYTYGSGDWIATVLANSTLYFTVTIPAGETSSVLAASSLSQNTNLNVFIVQGSTVLTPTAANNYYSDFKTIYTKYGWGFAVNLPMTITGLTLATPATAPTAWAIMTGDNAGESITLQQNGTIPTENTTPLLAGKYYIVVTNTGAKDNQFKLNMHHY